MTSSWLSHNIPQKKQTDKDFMKLNKLASKNRVTTCKALYTMKKDVDIRLKEAKPKPQPTFPASRKQISIAVEYSSAFEGARHHRLSSYDITYGQANRPQTPIRTIVNNHYGSIAELQQSKKNSSILTLKKQLKQKAPPRGHTRASSAL